jgi:hypothetical protein
MMDVFVGFHSFARANAATVFKLYCGSSLPNYLKSLYAIQFWGTASTSNIKILECFQLKTLPMIVDAAMLLVACFAVYTAKQATWQPHKNNTAHQKLMRSTWVPRVFTVIRK